MASLNLKLASHQINQHILQNNAEIITAKVEIKNTGDAFLKNVDVDLNIGN